MTLNQVSTNVRDHGATVDLLKNRVKCNYCGKAISGFSRLKCHLGGIRGDVTPCLVVPADVKEVFSNELSLKKQVNLSKEVGELYHPCLPVKRKTHSIKCHQIDLSGITQRRKRDCQPYNSRSETFLPSKRVFPVTSAFRTRDSPLDEVKKRIGRFFYETATDFNAIKSPSFRTMMNATSGCGQIIPSREELKGWILEDAVREMQNYVKDIRSSWTVTGCSIILDGWKDDKGRDLVNVIVNCPRGAVYLKSSDISGLIGDVDAMLLFLDRVLDEVGIQNVVQIITYSTSAFMKEVGKRLADKHLRLFWSVSASTCLELMLEKLESTSLISGILEKARMITRFVENHPTVLQLLRAYTQVDNLVMPSKIRSAVPYLTLENIVLEKEGLEKVFSSSEWKTSDQAKSDKGKKVAHLLEDPNFWDAAIMVLNASIPLVRVLCLINENNQPEMDLIYETIDQAKETIKEGLGNKKRLYMPFWEEIDEIWDEHLHSELHSAGYNLNPILFYSNDFYSDLEVGNGMCLSLVKMARDLRTQDLIMKQLNQYLKTKIKAGTYTEEDKPEWLSDASQLSPVLWWTKYKDKYPELQQVAIRILSQTCNGASNFRLKRSLAEMLLTEGKNRIEQQILTNLIFVHYNLRLQNFQLSKSESVSADEIDPMHDWMLDEVESDDVNIGEPAAFMDMKFGNTSDSGASTRL